MNKLHFTREQITKILEEIAQKEGGLNELMTLSLEALMRAERTVHNKENQDVSNGYRRRKSFGHGKLLELQVPRSRYGQFYPVLLSILKDQEEESKRLAFSLYGSGLTTEQVGEVFDELYGRHYSKSNISRIFDYAREEVQAWLERPLEAYYPILYIDAVFISTRRVDSVMKEAYYTILGVRPDRRREVLAIVNFPTESSIAWQEVLGHLKTRGVRKVNLVVSDGLKGIEQAVASEYPQAEVQLCVVHLERNVQKHIRPKEKAAVSQDFKEVFDLNNKEDTIENGWQRWLGFCRKWGTKYPSIKRMGEDQRNRLYFTCLGYDYRIRSMIYTTNWIERLNRDYKRVTRMRGALPNAEATLLLLGRVAMTRKAYSRKIPKLDYETEKFSWEE